MKTILGVIALVFLSGCASVPPLNDEEKSVRIYKKSDPPSTCKELGKVLVNKAFVDPNEWENLLKRATHQKGGSAVQLDYEESTHMQGTAFSCPKA